jgi:ATP-dependent exoDNAse (exonuclease V) beta subunit
MALWDTREKDMERLESVRLLYVAMTRARDALYLVGGEKTPNGSLSSHLLAGRAWPQADRVGTLNAIFVEAKNVGVLSRTSNRVVPIGLEEATVAVESWTRQEKFRSIPSASRTRTASSDLQNEKLSLTSDQSQGGSVLGSHIGQLCHRVLQTWDYRKPVGGLLEEVDRAVQWLAPQSPRINWPQASAEAHRILTVYLSSERARRLSQIEILCREMPFVFAEGKTVFRGAIDLIYRDAGKIVIVDFKSENVDELSAETIRERYAQQGLIYVDAVRRAWSVEAEFQIIFLRRPEL